MNVLENIKTAITLLEQNEEYRDELNELQSITDRKIDYWLHYIELNPLKTAETYRIVKEIKQLRNQRRIYKNDLELLKIFKDNEVKMCNASNRKILMAQVCKTANKQENAKYSYDAYTEEEANEVLGIKKESETNESNRFIK